MARPDQSGTTHAVGWVIGQLYGKYVCTYTLFGVQLRLYSRVKNIHLCAMYLERLHLYNLLHFMSNGSSQC